MALVRFVHAADLHLDSPFRGLLDLDAPVAGLLQRATFAAYDRIVALCLEERVDALLVAGDVYDGADRSLRAQLRFVEGLRRLSDAGIRTFVCHGNHDPLDGWEARIPFPDGCHRFGPDVQGIPVFPAEPQRATVYGVSYPTREVRENLVSRFPVGPLPGFSIGLLHANVGANTGHEPYAPCTLEDLAAVGMDYWALGHVHTRQVLRPDAPAVVYPGNPQGRHANEAGTRGVFLVEVSDTGRVAVDFRATDVVRWHEARLDIGALQDEGALLEAGERVVEEVVERASGRDVVIRLLLTGRGPVHATLVRPGFAEHMREHLNEWGARGRPRAFCERVTVATAPRVDRGARLESKDFVGDLLRLVDQSLADPTAMDGLTAALMPLYADRRVARHLGDALPDRERMEALVRAAEGMCLDRLVEGETA